MKYEISISKILDNYSEIFEISLEKVLPFVIDTSLVQNGLKGNIGEGVTFLVFKSANNFNWFVF